MKRIVIASFLGILMISCKSKKPKNADTPVANFFVSDYLKGQIARLDTAHILFLKIETSDGRIDTSTVTNKEAKQYAKDFMELPDIAVEGVRDDYEVSHLYDDLQEAFVFTYITREDHPVTRQDVTVEPQMNAAGKNDIRSVYVDYLNKRDDSMIRKNLLWEADKNFQVTTTTEVPGQPEKIKKIKIVWNGFERQTN